MAPHPERSIDTPRSDKGQSQDGLVGVPGRPRLESRRIFQNAKKGGELSGVCRKTKNKADSRLKMEEENEKVYINIVDNYLFN